MTCPKTPPLAPGKASRRASLGQDTGCWTARPSRRDASFRGPRTCGLARQMENMDDLPFAGGGKTTFVPHLSVDFGAGFFRRHLP